MPWFILAIIGAFSDATYFALVKKFFKNISQYVLASGVFLSSFVILFLISAVRGFPTIGSAFYFSVLITVVINIIGAIFYFKALKISDLSLSVPMLSFTPVFLIFTSFILLKELPTLFGILGIFLIVIGSYILNIARDNKSLSAPFKNIFKNKGVFYMLIVAFLWSVSSNFDKLVVKNSDPVFGYFVVYLLLCLAFLVISFIQKQKIKEIYKENFHKFLFIGIFLALTAVAINTAYTMQIVPYVISLKRLTVLFSVFYGGLLFREKDILRRIFGALVMLIGAILVILL